MTGLEIFLIVFSILGWGIALFTIWGMCQVSPAFRDGLLNGMTMGSKRRGQRRRMMREVEILATKYGWPRAPEESDDDFVDRIWWLYMVSGERPAYD